MKADVVLSLDADFLTTGPGAARYSRDFADRRKIRQNGKDAKEIGEGSKKEGVKADQVNRLYSVESVHADAAPARSLTNRLAAAKPARSKSFFARAAGRRNSASRALRTKGAAARRREGVDWPLADDLKGEEGQVHRGRGRPPARFAARSRPRDQRHPRSHRQDGHPLAPARSVRPADGKKVIDLKTLLTGEMAAKQVDVLLVLSA